MIEVKDLYYTYNSHSPHKTDAIKGINLTVKDGEWLSILGHNGSGKSTLSKLLVGLLKPTGGTITYDGILLNEENLLDIRKKVGIVFQNPDNQFVGVNVRYDIAFGLENRMLDRQTMNELIDKCIHLVRMEDYLEREPNTLSGGQKQRVAIAGILALDTDVIIFDEATSMLDPEGVKEISELIKKLNKEYKKTIISITHDLDIGKMADRAIILKDGEIIADGDPEELYKNKELLESSNLFKPLDLELYDVVTKDEVLSKHKEIGDVLWEYHLKK